MSNGRRAWRRWVKSYHKHEGAHTSKGVYWPLSSARLRRHADWTPDSAPRPWSPSSVVGATQSARKRAARQSGHDYREGLGRVYRIGERLRPCPGCLRCRSCTGCEALSFEGDICQRCGREAPTGDISCDGSGTVPARKATR